MSKTEILDPIAIDLDTWILGAGPNKVSAVSDNSDATYIVAPNGTDYDTYYVAVPTADPTAPVVRLILHIRYQGNSPAGFVNTVLRWRQNAVDKFTGTISINNNGVSEQAIDVTALRPEGGIWTPGDFGSGAGKASFGMKCNWSGGTNPGVFKIWVQFEAEPVGVLLAQARRMVSASAYRGRRLPMVGKVTVGPLLEDLELGEYFWVSDKLAPTPEGLGWGTGIDEAQPLWCTAIEEDLAAHTLTPSGIWMRDQLVTLVDGGRIPGPVNALAEGLLRLDPGGITRTFARSSSAWVDQPDGLVGQVTNDVDAIGKLGIYAEGKATDDVKCSSFDLDSASNWTLTGSTGYATDEPLFIPEVLARILDLNGHASTPGAASQAGISLPRGSTGKRVLSFDYKTVSPATAALRIQRANDGFYLNSGGTWQAGATDIPLPDAPTRTRGWIKIDNTGGAANTTYTLTLKAVGTSGKVRWWHIQPEKARFGDGWPSSRIVTRGATASREHSHFVVSNHSGEGTWPAQDGTARIRLVPFFSSANVSGVGTGPFYVYHLAYSSDFINVLYLSDGSKWRFTRHISGTSYNVDLDMALTAGELYDLVVRWQSRSQNGDAPGTFSAWCNGSKASAVGPTAIAETSPSSLVRGGLSNADGTQWEGALWFEEISPFVFSDGEL